MNQIFKVTNVFRDTIGGKNPGDAPRQKVEVTLCYHETYFSSQMGLSIRRQYRQVSILDDAASNWNVPVGSWIVANLTDVAYENRTVPGRVNVITYLDNYIVINSMEEL